ncbi:MAG: recombinase family protein [Rhizobiaceae bacterium]
MTAKTGIPTMAKRAAIYARYSSDLQTDRSIDDQVALCSDFASRQNLIVGATYDDRARSGASIMGRDGLLAMMDAAREGAFDVLVVEALDRLSRDQEDLAGIYKRLTHAGIEIRAVHDGTADIVQIGIRGLVGALYLQDLAHKVRRGMTGVVRDGRSAGGKAFGYTPVPGRTGELQIVESEAETVRRIFRAYLEGASPREIAGDLNREHIAPPRGRFWRASTINGNTKRGHGILHNPIYDGRLIWNRVRMVKDPETGRRVSRVNPEAEWQEAAAAHLRIVPPDLFAAVQKRKADAARTGQPRPRRDSRILSGLLKCGVCGAGMSIKDHRRGITRIVCTQAIEARSCTNRHRFTLEAIEHSVLDGLKARLIDRAQIDYFVECYNAERKRLAAGSGAERAKAQNRLTSIGREFDRAADLAIKGILTDAEAQKRLAALREERTALERTLAALPEAPKVVALQPALVGRYLRSLDRLREELAPGAKHGAEARAAIRDVIEKVVVYPPENGRGPEQEVHGVLSRLVSEGGGDHAKTGLRYHQPDTAELAPNSPLFE